MQNIPVYIHLFIHFPTKATQMDRIDRRLHIVKARILEDALTLIRWMRCGDRAAAVVEGEDGDEVKKEEEDGQRGKEVEEKQGGDRQWRDGQTGSNTQAGPIHQSSQPQ